MNREAILFIRIAPWLERKYAHPREAIFPFSIGYAATQLLKQGMDVKVIDTVVEPINAKKIINYILIENPNFVVVDSCCSTEHIARIIASEVKSRQKGVYFVFFGQSNIENYDVCIAGELEPALPPIIENYRSLSPPKKINRVNEFVENLDMLPHIDYSLFKFNRYSKKSVCAPILGKKRWGFLLSTRGCPFNCTFCSSVLRNSLGKNYRIHSASWVIDEIKRLRKDYRINAISFEDDCFTYDKEHVEQICEGLIKNRINLYWTARTRADLLDTYLLKRMKEAGCFALSIGVESGSDRILKLLNKNQDREKILEVIKLMKKQKIMPLLYFIIGNPTETCPEMEETFQLAKKLGPSMIQVHYFTPYLDSEISRSLDRNGLSLINISHYDSLRYNLSAIPDNILKGALKKFYLRYFLSLEYFYIYLRYRLPYVIFDFNEIRLILDTLRFLLKGKLS